MRRVLRSHWGGAFMAAATFGNSAHEKAARTLHHPQMPIIFLSGDAIPDGTSLPGGTQSICAPDCNGISSD
jgi:hypothetical protein